ncbi:hypothetical protein C8J56DRAFT_21952 [Mycena floridula]|nr:hypothetical protein C8J56DRAFT_21952 [Mycena floridula]
MLITSFVIFLVALGQQVVPAAARFRFTFSQIEQCQPVTISFTGNDGAKAIPSSLLLLPFNSTPVSIPIPNAAANSTGVTITFLPLAAGTQFIASLDDESGDSSARVSDIFRVLPSPTGDNSCLPSQPQTAPQFTMPTSVAQCESFAVAYSSAAPAVRVFAPNGGSFGLTLTGDRTSAQTAFYSMNVTRGTQVVLMAFPLDAPDTGVTSSLMTVGGDASSDKSCFVFTSKGNNNNKSSSSSSNGPPKVSKAVIIALSVVGGVVSLVTILLIFYIVRERRKRLAARSSFGPRPFGKTRFIRKARFILIQD